MAIDFLRSLRRWIGVQPPFADTGGNPFSVSVLEMPPRTLYPLMDAYYENSMLYEWLTWVFGEYGDVTMANRPLANPAYRVVEYHASHLWPGALETGMPIVGKTKDAVVSPAVLEAIGQIWDWSNWGAQKQVVSRWAPLYGNMWIKVAQSADLGQVVLQPIRPEHVTDFEEDTFGRRFLRRLRMDIPKVVDQSKPVYDRGNRYWVTEYWDKPGNVYMRWEFNDLGPEAPIDRLGLPDVMMAMKLNRPLDGVVILPDGRAVRKSQFGFDFIPVVHAPWMDLGRKLGVGAFMLQLAKIDKLNEVVTNMLATMFPDVVWALQANANDKAALPLPGMMLNGQNVASSPEQPRMVSMGKKTVWSIPGMGTLQSLVPNLPIAAMSAEIERYEMSVERDLPEMAYARLMQSDKELSGAAIRRLMSGAIDKTMEARGNLNPGLVRAHEMALTIGSLPGGPFTNVGTFEDGDFAHRIGDAAVIAPSPEEDLENELKKVEIATGKKAAGWDMKTILTEFGYPPEKVEEIMAAGEVEAQKEQDRLAKSLADGAFAGDGGDGSGFGQA